MRRPLRVLNRVFLPANRWTLNNPWLYTVVASVASVASVATVATVLA